MGWFEFSMLGERQFCGCLVDNRGQGEMARWFNLLERTVTDMISLYNCGEQESTSAGTKHNLEVHGLITVENHIWFLICQLRTGI